MEPTRGLSYTSIAAEPAPWALTSARGGVADDDEVLYLQTKTEPMENAGLFAVLSISELRRWCCNDDNLEQILRKPYSQSNIRVF